MYLIFQSYFAIPYDVIQFLSPDSHDYMRKKRHAHQCAIHNIIKQCLRKDNKKFIADANVRVSSNLANNFFSFSALNNLTTLINLKNLTNFKSIVLF